MRRTQKAFAALGSAIANDQRDIAMDAMRQACEHNSMIVPATSVMEFQKLDAMRDAFMKLGREFDMFRIRASKDGE